MQVPTSLAAFQQMVLSIADFRGDRYGIQSRLAIALGCIGVLVLAVAGWAATAELAGAVVSQGTVVVDRYSKRVQHRDGGIVSAISVKNGDRVREGDVLVKLDEAQLKSEHGVLQSQLTESRVRRARLFAEQELAEKISFPKELLQSPTAAPILEGETRLFNYNKKQRDSQELQLRQRIEQLMQEKGGYLVQRNAKAGELALIRKELQGVRQLHAKNYTPVTKLYALEREETKLEGERGNLISQEARVGGQITEVEQQILTLQQAARTDAQKELRTVEARIEELREREASTLDKLNRLEIRAPDTGVVHELMVHTVGGVVSPAEQIMLIVPGDEKLAIEFRVSPADIDQVRVGQPTRMKFTSFNQRTTPEVSGEVSYVSADVSRDGKDRQDFFVVRSVVSGQATPIVGNKTVLPGMPVEVQVSTEKRTALSYFLKPLSDHFGRAFRER